jgi:CBS domain-containing protein
MTKQDLVIFSPDTAIAQAAEKLLSKGINGAPVLDENRKLLGIVCQSDLIIQQKKLPLPSLFTILDGFISLTSTKQIEKEVEKITATTVTHAMTPDPVTVTADTPIDEIASLMVDKKYHTLPVMEEGKLVGIIGKEDILRTIMGEGM